MSFPVKRAAKGKKCRDYFSRDVAAAVPELVEIDK